ncbi:MAG: histidine kinase, partial [Pseudomonadota bacterium]
MRARFRLIALVQVLGLAVTLALLAFAVTRTAHVAVPLVLGLVALLQVVALVHSVEAHVASLEEFFAAIRYEDFSQRFVTDDVDAELKAAFNRVLDRFQQTRAEREVQAAYLETVVRHVPIPLLSEKRDGSLGLLNNPLRRLTGLSVPTKLDDLVEVDPGLPAAMRAIPVGEQQLLQTRLRDVPVEWRVSVSEIRVGGASERLYAVENLSGELTARESSAWRNLIRVLTHEIMNTLTPVASLAQTCEGLIDDPDASDEIAEAIRTIARRSDGLMHFVGRYRELLQVPTPTKTTIVVHELLQGIVSLMGGELDRVALTVDVTPLSLEVSGDRSLLEQV